MDKVNEKKKFRIQKTIGEKEYIEALKFLPGIFWSRVLGLCLYLFVICITFYFLMRMSFSDAFITTIILCIIVIISCVFQKKKILYKIYQDTYQCVDFNFFTTIDFYDTYLITKSEYFTIKILYTKITKIKEVDKYFYLYSDLQTVMIAKKDCSEGVCSFLRNLPVPKYICKKKGYTFKEKKVIDERKTGGPNQKYLSILFWFLFFASIFSIYGAFFTISFLGEGIPASVALSMNWVAWLWLPFPLLSLILGIIYSRYRFSSKNVVIGGVCSFLLIIVGSFCFAAAKPSHQFSEIKPYQDILQINIPKKATYYHDNIFEVWLDNFVDISILYVTYDDKAGEKLAQDIKKSDYWLTSYEVEKLYDILPTSTQSEYEDDYYLVYNKDTKQYNMLPESEGKQHFIVMKYDSVYYRFYIYEYTLNYVK